jgi:4-hydroxy 2-oxovalerate aldolase
MLAGVLKRIAYQTTIDLFKSLDAAEVAAQLFVGALPESNGITIVSGLAGVFSGFSKPVQRAAKQMGVDPRNIFLELGKRKVLGGQEDLIVEVAAEIAARNARAK